jgi:iron(III) transport system substrate-binding protein
MTKQKNEREETMAGSRNGRAAALGGAVVLALAGLALAGPALAQGRSVADVAGYEQADRMEMLAAEARKEGTLMIYTSAPIEDMQALIDPFQEKYGVKVEVWRGGSEETLQRAVAETQAGRHDVDLIETNGPELEALFREQILQPIKSPTLGQLLPAAVPAHGAWIGTRLNVITAAYNTSLIGPGDVPKTWDDLLKPDWKGKLGIEAEDYDWMATVAGSFANEDEGIAFFRKLGQTNGYSVRKGHTLLTNLVASGEVPFALTVYQYKAAQLKEKGAPVDWLAIPPAAARVNGVGLSRGAPHPNAAVLFVEFELTEGQTILAKRGFTPTNIKIQPLPEDLKVTVIDSAKMLDQSQRWRDLYQDIVLRQ